MKLDLSLRAELEARVGLAADLDIANNETRQKLLEKKHSAKLLTEQIEMDRRVKEDVKERAVFSMSTLSAFEVHSYSLQLQTLRKR